MSKRLKHLALAIACSAALTAIAPVAAPTDLGFVSAAKADQLDEFRSVLSRFGSFQTHARYGEVWVPAETTVPQGWHPYPPCYWVYDKTLGWHFDDRTDWGRIVHHYGRWTHEAGLGWIWVPGQEFSPGWVVWRSSEAWVGWAPLPPEQDIREISAQAFNTDKHWIFMDARELGTRCADGTTIASAPQHTAILQQTRLVTDVRFVGGIAVFVLPPSLTVNVVDINVGIFTPWTPCFFGSWFWNWNWLMNNTVINVNLPQPAMQQCPQPNNNRPNQPGLTPIKSNPPPAPGGLRTNVPMLVPSIPATPTPGFTPRKPGASDSTPGFTMPKQPTRYTEPQTPKMPGAHRGPGPSGKLVLKTPDMPRKPHLDRPAPHTPRKDHAGKGSRSNPKIGMQSVAPRTISSLRTNLAQAGGAGTMQRSSGLRTNLPSTGGMRMSQGSFGSKGGASGSVLRRL